MTADAAAAGEKTCTERQIAGGGNKARALPNETELSGRLVESLREGNVSHTFCRALEGKEREDPSRDTTASLLDERARALPRNKKTSALCHFAASVKARTRGNRLRGSPPGHGGEGDEVVSETANAALLPDVGEAPGVEAFVHVSDIQHLSDNN